MADERIKPGTRMSVDPRYDTAYDSPRVNVRLISPRLAILLWLGVAAIAWWTIGQALSAIT